MKHADKIKAGKLLSQFIREIANEAVIPIADAGTDSGVRMATRAEALARKAFDMALGYEETVVNAKGVEVIKKHGPDKAMMTMVWDRMEGRVPTTDAKDQKRKASVAERVGEQSRDRLNALAKEAGRDTTGGKTKTKTKRAVPPCP